MSAADPSAPIDRLIEIMATLRSEQGCPWDREQTLASLKPYCIEEAYEVLEAIDSGDPDLHCEELGDLLLQVVFQSQLQQEAGHFSFDEVATAISDKLVRRHPHVFGDTVADTADEVLQNWDAIKKTEKGGDESRSILEGIPAAMPALLKAQETQKRAARAGFDWPDTVPVFAKIREEIDEFEEALQQGDTAEMQNEIGDVLFSIVNLCRKLKLPAEESLQQCNRKFKQRFQRVEELSLETSIDLKTAGLEQLDAWWDQAKAEESAGA